MNYLDKALRIINDRRLDAEKLARENKELALKNPEFAKVYRQYMDEVIAQARTGKFNSNLNALKSKVDEGLKKLNLGSISPVYNCSLCQDTGYNNGKQCQCLKKELNILLMQESGFGELVDFKNVNFSIFENKEYMKKVYEKMQAWCNSDFNKNMVFLSGGTGTGKTYITKCMASELIKRGKLIRLVTAFKLNQDCLKSHTCRDFEEKQSLLNQYLDCEVLFIDDLGTEVNNSSITSTYLYTILNERKVRNLPTVITSNLELADLSDNYDERIYSRIADNNTIKIQFTGKDLRLKK